MRFALDAAYAVAGLFLVPLMVVRRLTAGRHIAELRAKLLGPDVPEKSRPRVWFHGVSLGEVQLLATVIAGFRERHPDWDCVISATTETGLAEARKRFPNLAVIPWPFDFSPTVRRALVRVQPNLVVLAEGEIWPNFLREAEAREIPVVVVNARMSPRSRDRYMRVRPLAKKLILDRISAWGVQTEEYANNLTDLGVERDRLTVTGSVKYDGAVGDRNTQKVIQLRSLFNLGPTDRVWVAGSTHAPEEKIILDAFRRLRVKSPSLRLILVPRRPERFDDVAKLIDSMHFSFARRSRLSERLTDKPAVILVDTVGELSDVWGLADVAFVGGSLDGKRGGQSMIEPAGYGAAVVFGPAVWNFRDAARRLLEVGGAAQVRNSAAVREVVGGLLADPIGMRRMGETARRLVGSQQGALERTLGVIEGFVTSVKPSLRRAG